MILNATSFAKHEKTLPQKTTFEFRFAKIETHIIARATAEVCCALVDGMKHAGPQRFLKPAGHFSRSRII